MFSARSRLALCGFFLLIAFASMASQSAYADEAASNPRLAMKVPSQDSPSDLPPSRDAAPANLEEDKAERERQEQLRTVSIMNYTARPVGYRLSRTSGRTWTHLYTLPGKTIHRFTADNIEDPSVVRTLNLFGKSGYVFICFRVANGWDVFKILTNSSYAYVENSNGHGELVDPSTAKPLARVPAGDEEKIIKLLEANHCFIEFQDIQMDLSGP
jgi:hypothetical protein